MSKRTGMCIAGGLLLAAASAWGQEAAVNIQRVLDNPVQLDVTNAPIGEVFSRLQAATGVEFVIDEDTLECLPYGDQTRLAVTLRNVTLRHALSPMLTRQALQWEIDGQTIRVRPSEPLYRICRRVTFEELTTLGHLLSDRLKPTSEAPAVMDQLRALSGNEELRLFFHVKADEAAAMESAERALPGTAADWLDMLCHGRGWTWYLWGDDIVIVDKQTQVRRQLEKHVSLRYRNAPLVTVLLDLARKARVRLTLTPGVMSLLAENTRENFNLVMAEASIAQALEVISGATGLVFTTGADGIGVEASESLLAGLPGAADSQRARARYFVRMTLPGPDGEPIEVFMRPDELPEDIQLMIEQARDDYISRLRGEVQP